MNKNKIFFQKRTAYWNLEGRSRNKRNKIQKQCCQIKSNLKMEVIQRVITASKLKETFFKE